MDGGGGTTLQRGGSPRSFSGLITAREGSEVVSVLMDEGRSDTQTPPPPALEPELLFLQYC